MLGGLVRPVLNLPMPLRTQLLPNSSNLTRFSTLFCIVKGQLQRFHKLISNDRFWPTEHGFEVIFEKSLFVFEISAFKVTNKRGIHSQFHSFSENNNRETFVCDVTSDQSSMISSERSDLVTAKQVKTAKYDGFWKKLWFTVLLMTA